MSESGFNPRFGWHPGPDYLYGGIYGYGYPWPIAGDVPFAAPPGQGWFEIPAMAMPHQQPMPWGMPGSMNPFMQHLPPYTATGPGPVMTYNGEVPDGGFPGLHFRNAHGGIGNEPGYDYIFPSEHCKIHVLINDKPPWENRSPCRQKCFNVPTNITIKELMQQFGCNNKEPAKNKLYEVTQGGDGKWYKGIVVSGDQKEMVAKIIGAIGWNKERDGVSKDFVWLYFTKD